MQGNNRRTVRICRVASIPFVIVHHLGSQIRAAKERGHDVTIVTSPDGEAVHCAKELGAHFYPLHIPRAVSPWSDLRALIVLYRIFRENQFEIVHSITPKAGLLCTIAGLIARVPIRLHTFTGQPWMTLSGPMRWAAKFSDQVILRCNTICYADSRSQADYLVRERVAAPGQITVLGSGSLSGVDLKRFDPDRLRKRRAMIRKDLKIPESSLVITYIGRITRDKGIAELVAAFSLLQRDALNIYLILAGPLEQERTPIPSRMLDQIADNPFIKLTGYTEEPEKYLAATDVFCLPSYREGFGTVVIEAAAMGIPAVGTKIIGLTDAIVDEETGILVPPHDRDALAKGLKRLLNDRSLRERMGRTARNRAIALYDESIVIPRILDEYDRLASHHKEQRKGFMERDQHP